MKRLIIVFWLLVVAYPLSAVVPLDSIGSYTNFVIKKEMWVCNSVAFPIDISYDAFNVDYKTIAQGGDGYFIQVKPGTHKDGSVLPNEEDIIQNPSKGVLNVVGKPAGVYEYIFVSMTDNFCGMNKDEQSVVRVYIAPQLTGFPVLTNVCPGTTEDIDFNNFIPPEIRYFIEEMSWKISYTRDGQNIAMPVKAGLATVGDNVYNYTISDTAGPFKGKYSAMQSTVYGCPQGSAVLTHTVKIREGGEYVIPNKNISFCTDILRLVPETEDSLSVNLFGYLGSSAPNGKWSIAYPISNDISVNHLNVSEDEGLADIKWPLLKVLSFDSVVFKYSYKDCVERDTFTLLTLHFTDKKFQSSLETQKEYEVCRNLVSGVIELSSIFGFSTPLTSGIWSEIINDTLSEEMLYGAIDISKMKSGSLYSFRYDLSQAVDAMCLMQGKSVTFNLRLHDIEIANAEVKICKQQFADGVRVNLSRYVPGLNDTTRINPDLITWRDNNGKIIPRPDNYQMKSDDPLQTADTSSYKMLFQYDVRSNCGPYTGNLYVSVVDSVASTTSRKIVICYTDDYARHIDLFQILGILGANGQFIRYDVPESNSKYDAAQYDSILKIIETTGIMDASILFDTKYTSETYTFRYLSSNDTCVPHEAEITVVITKELEKEQEQDSQYEYYYSN
jgi:hypothetical protein